MNKGFTIIELLVASLLLGILVTILTMIFSQSSIAWRTGTAGVADLDAVRDNMAEIREEADNAFIMNGEVHRVIGLWRPDGQLWDRAYDATGSQAGGDNLNKAGVLSGKLTGTTSSSPIWSTSRNMVSVGQSGSARSIKTYTVNVKSAGPDKQFDTWDDVWSFPDDFE